MSAQLPPPLNCPDCGSMMAPKELNGTQVFMCSGCGDFFMKKDTFKTVVGVAADQHAHHKSGKVHNCPGCNGEMSGTDVMGVEIDFCPHCDIVVSDRASFSHVIEDFDGPKEEAKGLNNLMFQMDVARNVDNFQKSTEELDEAPDLKVEDLFILYKSGILMSSFTTTVDESLDKEVLGSMMMAITEFVQTSFKPKTKGRAKLSSIKIEEREIAFEHGENIVVALALCGNLAPAARKRISEAIKKVESENSDVLSDWDGDLGKVKEIGLSFQQMLMK